jgi:hypothetical protein
MFRGVLLSPKTVNESFYGIYQCKSEHKPGTAFVHFFLFTADYFYQRGTPALTNL